MATKDTIFDLPSLSSYATRGLFKGTHVSTDKLTYITKSVK